MNKLINKAMIGFIIGALVSLAFIVIVSLSTPGDILYKTVNALIGISTGVFICLFNCIIFKFVNR